MPKVTTIGGRPKMTTPAPFRKPMAAPISSTAGTFQTLAHAMADLQTEIELLRSLIYRAAEAMIAGADVTQLATMAKLKAGQLGRELPSACLQYWGGMGYMNETPVSRAFRDSRLASIGGGADEVMLTILCKGMGTLPGMQ